MTYGKYIPAKETYVGLFVCSFLVCLITIADGGILPDYDCRWWHYIFTESSGVFSFLFYPVLFIYTVYVNYFGRLHWMFGSFFGTTGMNVLVGMCVKLYNIDVNFVVVLFCLGSPTPPPLPPPALHFVWLRLNCG